jgi:hypothetical protein
MKKWRAEPVPIGNINDLEVRLNAIEALGGKVQQILPASNPLNIYVVWYTETAPAAK